MWTYLRNSRSISDATLCHWGELLLVNFTKLSTIGCLSQSLTDQFLIQNRANEGIIKLVVKNTVQKSDCPAKTNNET